MPELPEVETVKNSLKKLIVNKEITSIEVIYPNILKNCTVDEFNNKLTGQSITNIRRLGKYLFIDFEDNTLVSHLRMEGKYNYFTEYQEAEKHDLVCFYFTDESQLFYNDTRKFGTMELVELGKELELKSVSKLGLEPFDQQFTKEYLKSKFKNKKLAIKSVLLDQTIVAGLGNIYVDEVLFLAKIHPLVPAGELTDTDIDNIINASVLTLNKAIKAGGTTIKSFTSTGSVHGKFQQDLQMYGRTNEECYVCGTRIEKIKVGGRGTHFCPVCQIR